MEDFLCSVEDEKMFPNFENGCVSLYPFSKISEDIRFAMSPFLFSHAIPGEIWRRLDPSSQISIPLTETTKLSTTCEKFEFVIENEGASPVKLRFPSVFYMSTFLNALSFNFAFLSTQINHFSLTRFRETCFSTKQKAKPIRKSLASHVHDLYAHQSLLEYLGYPLSGQDKVEELTPLEDSCILKLLESPQDPEALAKLGRSRVDPLYALLLLLILSSDSPFISASQQPHDLPLEHINTAPPLYILDNLCLGGSSNINADYQRLKIQWSTITATQLQHMENMAIIIKHIENAVLTTFVSDHPLTRVVFDVMISLFTLKDDMSTFHHELFDVLVEISQLFHPIDKLVSSNLEDIEHVVFWLFISIVNKTQLATLLERKDPEKILDPCLKLVRMFHPLLFDLLTAAGINNFVFLSNLILSLFTKVLSGPNLWNIWIAALASGDPLQFLQLMLAAALIVSYPEIIDQENVVKAVESAITNVMTTGSIDFLIGISWKLKDAVIRND